MSQTWAEILLFICVVAQFFCLTASVTSASRMMYAFSRDRAVPGHPLWQQGRPQPCPAERGAGDRCPLRAADGPDDLERLVGYRRRHRDRGDRPLHRVRAFPSTCASGCTTSFEPGAWSLGRHYKWIDLLSIGWVAIITILFIFPLYTAGLPWETTSRWELTNYTVLWFAAIGIVFGGWCVRIGEELVQGPRASGHRGRTRADRGRLRVGWHAATGPGCLARQLLRQ